MMLTPEEIATDLRLTVGTVYEYLKSGELKALKIGGRWRIEEIDLQDFKRRQAGIPRDPYGFSPRSPRSIAARKGAITRNK